jgi:hypothetical protein
MKKHVFFLLIGWGSFFFCIIGMHNDVRQLDLMQKKVEQSAVDYIHKNSSITYQDTLINPVSLGSRMAENAYSWAVPGMFGAAAVESLNDFGFVGEQNQNNFLWVKLMVAGGAAKIFFPVIRQLFVADKEAKIKKYLNFCEKFIFATKKYETLDDVRNAMKADDFWKNKNEMALYYALKAMITQSDRVLFLLDKSLGNSTAFKEQFDKAYFYADVLKYNLALLETFHKQELMEHKKELDKKGV